MIIFLFSTFLFWFSILVSLKRHSQNYFKVSQEARLFLSQMAIQLQLGEGLKINTWFNFLRHHTQLPQELWKNFVLLAWLIRRWQLSGLSLVMLLQNANETAPRLVNYLQKKDENLLGALSLWCLVQFIGLLILFGMSVINQYSNLMNITSPANFLYFAFMQMLAALIFASAQIKKNPDFLKFKQELTIYWGALFAINHLELGYFFSLKNWQTQPLLKKMGAHNPPPFTQNQATLYWEEQIKSVCSGTKEKLPLLNLLRSEMLRQWVNQEQEANRNSITFKSYLYWLILVLGWLHFLGILSLLI